MLHVNKTKLCNHAGQYIVHRAFKKTDLGFISHHLSSVVSRNIMCHDRSQCHTQPKPSMGRVGSHNCSIERSLPKSQQRRAEKTHWPRSPRRSQEPSTPSRDEGERSVGVRWRNRRTRTERYRREPGEEAIRIERGNSKDEEESKYVSCKR